MSSRRSRRGRNPDREDAEAKKQILAELARGHQLVQRPIGRGQKANVDRPGASIPNRGHLAVLDGTQQLDLHSGRNVADLVEQHRPAVGQFEQPLAILDGPGERARADARTARARSSPSSAPPGIRAEMYASRRALWR